MGMETSNVVRILLNLCVITSNEDARRILSLVKEVAVDGEQGATHDTASGGGYSRHLWITNMNALATNRATGSNPVYCDKTSPANVWTMAWMFVPKTLNTSLFGKLLQENNNKFAKISVIIIGGTQYWNIEQWSTLVQREQKLFKTSKLMFTFQNQHQEWNSDFDVLFEYKADRENNQKFLIINNKRQI